MKAGSLNKRVTIQQPGTTQDEIGQPVAGWVDVATVWANIRNRTGSEAMRSDSETSVVQASIRLRYRTDVDASMRVVYGARVYKIVAVLPDDVKKDHVDLVCEVIGG